MRYLDYSREFSLIPNDYFDPLYTIYTTGNDENSKKHRETCVRNKKKRQNRRKKK